MTNGSGRRADAARVIAVIPARGGSKGVPGKNLRRIGGVPLVARAAASALKCQSIGRVIVSTDDPAIAEAARAAGSEIMSRPAKLASDTASSESALLDVLERLERRPEVLVFIQATSPFLDPAEIDVAVQRVLRDEADVVFSAAPSHAFLWEREGDVAVGVNHDSSHRQRRQDRPPQYLETGGFYVMKVDGFLQARSRFFGRVDLAVIDDRRSLEIDTESQLEFAAAVSPLLDRPTPVDVDALITDFDGVHTDDRVTVHSDGSEAVSVSRSDGMGIDLLRAAGIPTLILSRETNPVVTARARKLGVDVKQGLLNKTEPMLEWLQSKGVDPSRAAYLGNDVNDLGCLELVGWPVAVADSHADVLVAARLVLETTGGHGAVRELADRILRDRSRTHGTRRNDIGRSSISRTSSTRTEERAWRSTTASRP